MKKVFLFICFLLSGYTIYAEEVVAKNFAELKNAVMLGKDVALLKSAIYNVTEIIFFQKDGQKIYTKDANRISEYAVLKITNPEMGQILNANSKSNILAEKLILDGNKYDLPSFKGQGQELVWFGGKNAQNQTLRNCVLMNTRTWSSFKMNEGSINPRIENTIILGSGVDARGNGRCDGDVPFSWGDGITCSAVKSKILNNIIIDSTDVGIVLFSAPESIIQNNVIAAISRESLGGINLVDGLYCYEVDKTETMLLGPDATRKYDYSVIVRNNLIDARGARIHVAIPMGACIWSPRNKPQKFFLGAKILDNEMAGDASAYGLVLSDVGDFEIMGNVSTGKNSGYGDGLRSILCDDPSPFIYDVNTVKSSRLQKDFKKMERSVEHLLRCNHGPMAIGGFFKGYKAYSYGEFERIAAVQTAYLEMLGRDPREDELERFSRLLNERQLPVDELRLILADTKEFINKNGKIKRERIHSFRTKKWMNLLDEAIGTSNNWDAKIIYKNTIKKFYSK